MALVSVFSAGLGQPEIAIPAAVASSYLGAKSINLSIIAGTQIGESFAETSSDASFKNLNGLLPYGDKIDDPHEPTPIDYYKKLIIE